MLSCLAAIFRLDDDFLVIIGSFLVLIFLYRFLNFSILEYFSYIKEETANHLYSYYKSLLLLQKDLSALGSTFFRVFLTHVSLLNLLKIGATNLVFYKLEKFSFIPKNFLIKVLFFNFKKFHNFSKLVGLYVPSISYVFRINKELNFNLDLLEEVTEKE